MYKSIIALIVFAFGFDASPAPQIGTDCTNGDFQCTTANTVQQCNLGTWVTINDCNTLGLVCAPGDFECVFPSPSCTDNSFQCLNNMVQQCSFGQWITLTTCDAASFCLPGDFECVPLTRASEFPGAI